LKIFPNLLGKTGFFSAKKPVLLQKNQQKKLVKKLAKFAPRGQCKGDFIWA